MLIPLELDQTKIIEKLLDWPFLGSALILICLFTFKGQIAERIQRGTITYSKAGVRVVSEGIEKLREDVNVLLDRKDAEDDQEPVASTGPTSLSSLQSFSQVAESDPHQNVIGAGLSQDAVVSIAVEPIRIEVDRIRDALSDPGFRWRSVERISELAGLNYNETLTILRHDPSVVLSKGRSGHRIARLRTR